MRFTERVPLYLPLAWPLWAMLFVVMSFILLMFFLHVVAAGFVNLGLGPGQVLFLMAASFLGSGINIPIKRFYTESWETIALPSFFGMRYVRPLFRRREYTVLAFNVGGCAVPVAVSLYLLTRAPEAMPATAICVALCAIMTYRMSRVVRGVGVAVPFFAPPLISALLAIAFAPPGAAAPVAYATGALGTLIGADLFNLRKITQLGTPVASIGGAGTWDGIFLSSLLASMLAF